MIHNLAMSLTVHSTQLWNNTSVHTTGVHSLHTIHKFLLFVALWTWWMKRPLAILWTVARLGRICIWQHLSSWKVLTTHLQTHLLSVSLPTNHTWHLCRIQLHLNLFSVSIFVNMNSDTAVISFHYLRFVSHSLESALSATITKHEITTECKNIFEPQYHLNRHTLDVYVDLVTDLRQS